MSTNINQTIYPLPVTETDVLVINQGLVPVMIGTMRDNLSTLGMPLQPLATIILSGNIQYYAVAPTAPAGGVPVDVIEGGMAFSPSPQQVVSVLNSQTLANQIGAAVPVPPSAAAIGGAVPQALDIATADNLKGSRLVNNLTSASQFSLAVGAVSAVLDCQGAVSFALNITPAVVTPPGTMCTGQVRIDWYDASQTYLLDRTLYEVNFILGTVPTITTINDQCLGAFAVVAFQGCPAIGTAPVTPTIACVFMTQNIPAGRPRITEVSSGGGFGIRDSSGMLLRTGSQAIPAGGTVGLYVAALSAGPLVIVVNGVSTGSAGAQFRIRGGFGPTSYNAHEIDIRTPANLALGSNPSAIQAFPSVPAKPLIFDIFNVSLTIAGVADVEVWSQPD